VAHRISSKSDGLSHAGSRDDGESIEPRQPPILTLPADSQSTTIRAKALVFEDPCSRALLDRIEQVARSDATVLVTGETGTGKEIVARQLHQWSRRASGPFIAVNCGAFSENLVESELFGHEKGAFTGALGAKMGWFEAAHNGTLFLDEIGDLPLPLQVKLLRVLQEGEVVRVGSRQPIRIDVRLVAATNVDLQEAMYAGHFREDLFYRLNVASITIPPLREREGDILPLSEYFLEMYRRRLGVGPMQLTPGAVEKLKAHSWPGNIRELENAIHHALLVCRDSRILAEDIRVTTQLTPRAKVAPGPSAAFSQPPPPPVPAPSPVTREPKGDPLSRLEAVLLDLFEQNLPKLYERVEETLMRTAYHYCEQNQLQTARLLGISRNVVRARLIQYGELNGALRGNSEPPPPTDVDSPAGEPEHLGVDYQN
jgi:sigma-54-specific transcriptional regulator